MLEFVALKPSIYRCFGTNRLATNRQPSLYQCATMLPKREKMLWLLILRFLGSAVENGCFELRPRASNWGGIFSGPLHEVDDNAQGCSDEHLVRLHVLVVLLDDSLHGDVAQHAAHQPDDEHAEQSSQHL